jgi:orotidine-5'-phosphate decarboxylase
MHFGDRLITAVRKTGHPLCVGIDPHLHLIPQIFRIGDMAPNSLQTASAVRTFVAAVMDRVSGKVAAIKPQSAFFEQMGWRGIEVLDNCMKRARANGIVVILDVKRGDIGSTAEAYATAYLSKGAPLQADAITVNPYLGMDSLEPFIEAADANDGGTFVLVKTTNPGAKDFQAEMIGKTPLYETVARKLSGIAKRHKGPETGWSSVGVVVGANSPEEALAVRKELPSSPFLIPGYGKQGGTAKDAMGGFVEGPEGMEGGVISSSREILFPKLPPGSIGKDWERAVDRALHAAITEIEKAMEKRESEARTA